jgi:hypothetical protein
MLMQVVHIEPPGFRRSVLQFTVALLVRPMTFHVAVINVSFIPKHLSFIRFAFITQISSRLISVKYMSIQRGTR